MSPKYLNETAKFAMQVYHRPADFDALKESHVPFSGSPRKHPYDPDIVILISDPYSSHTFYYEFKKADISYVEELPSIVNIYDETVPNVRVWVKKDSVGVRCDPFVVGAI